MATPEQARTRNVACVAGVPTGSYLIGRVPAAAVKETHSRRCPLIVIFSAEADPYPSRHSALPARLTQTPAKFQLVPCRQRAIGDAGATDLGICGSSKQPLPQGCGGGYQLWPNKPPDNITSKVPG